MPPGHPIIKNRIQYGRRSGKKVYSTLTTFNGSIAGLSFTEIRRVVFYRTLLPMIDADCQRSVCSSALVLSNAYTGFGSIANSEHLMVTPFIF